MVGAGAWGAGLLERIQAAPPVYPHRVEMAFFEAPPESGLRLERIISDARTTLYMRPEGASQMFVGWREGDRINTLADLQSVDPDHYRQTSHYPTLMEMYGRLKRTLPFMKDGFVHRTYACVYDYTADAMPILDRVSMIDGLFFALGFSGGGFSLSPWVGQVMAQFMATAQKTPELSLLSADRFSENRPVRWSNLSLGADRDADPA
jgi:glycine/D-amino acid oxidase-like deaminating enzyme